MKPKSLDQYGFKDRTYVSWSRMKQRVKRGYAALEDERWNSFDAFFEDMGHRPAGTTLDRKDGKRGYCKDNCRWATSAMQQRNRRDNVWLTHDGITLCTQDWAKRLGISPQALRRRIKTLGSLDHPALFSAKAPGKGKDLRNR